MKDEFTNRPSAPFTIEEPLSLVEGTDGKIFIQDVEAGENYGVIACGKLIMDSDPEENTIQTAFYKLSDVDRIAEEDEPGYVAVYTKMGDKFTHRKTAIEEEEYKIIDTTPILLSDNSLLNTKRIIMREYPNYKNFLFWDVTRNRPMFDRAMIGGKGIVPYGGLNSDELIALRLQLENLRQQITLNNGRPKEVSFKSHRQNTNDAIMNLAGSNPQNPFINKIRRIKWDGRERVDSFLEDIGCTSRLPDPYRNTVYLSIVGRGIFLSVLERNLNTAYKPIKFVPVIIGEQDSGKTTLCQNLGLEDWYRSVNVSFDQQKKFYEGAQGGVIVELKEGTQMKKDTVESMKAFADETRLQYRKSYGEDATEIPIMFTMIATTNDEAILKDDTGNTRFYPVFLNRRGTLDAEAAQNPDDTLQGFIDSNDANYTPTSVFDCSRAYILQMWAEALVLYRKGERWNTQILKSEEKREICQKVQGMAMQLSEVQTSIMSYLDTNFPNIGDEVTNRDVKRHLSNVCGYCGKDLDSAMRQFGHTTTIYGFQKVGETKKQERLTDGSISLVKVYIYRRVKQSSNRLSVSNPFLLTILQDPCPYPSMFSG